ncbi:MAG: glycosyltransferase [Chloroflexota bacterium]
MRFVLIGPVYPYRGGIAHYTTLFAQTLVERGHEIQLISFSRQYPSWLYPGSSDVDPSENQFTAQDPNYWLDSMNPLTWIQTFWRIRRFEPDVLILQWWTTFLAPLWMTLGFLFRLTTNCPLVFICHNVLPHESRPWDRWLTRFTLAWGSAFVVQSHTEQERLQRLIPSASTTVVPMPAFNMFEEMQIDQPTARGHLGIDLEAQVILFFGIVRAYKGLDRLLDAIPAVRAQVDHLSLWIVGEFWENKDEYLQQIERLGLGDCVSIVDRYVPNEEVVTYFSAADVLAAPYRYVTGSAVAQMAVSFGLPVVPEEIVAATTNQTDGSETSERPEPEYSNEALGRNRSVGDAITPGDSARGESIRQDMDTLAMSLIDFFEEHGRRQSNYPESVEAIQSNGCKKSKLSIEAKKRWHDLAKAVESAVLGKRIQ